MRYAGKEANGPTITLLHILLTFSKGVNQKKLWTWVIYSYLIFYYVFLALYNIHFRPQQARSSWSW